MAISAGEIEATLRLRDQLSPQMAAAVQNARSASQQIGTAMGGAATGFNNLASSAKRSLGDIVADLTRTEKEIANLKKDLFASEAKGAGWVAATTVQLDEATKKADALKKELSSTRKELNSTGDDVGKVGMNFQQIGSSLGTIGRGMTAAFTVPIVGATVAAAKFAIDYETNMTRVTTLSGISEQGMQQMKKAVLELAPSVGVGPNELAKALLAVTSTGIKGAEAMDILKLSARATAVGMGDTTTVARALTSIMQAYGSSGLTASTAMEVMFKAVKDGNLEADTLAGSLGRVIGIASELGVTFQEVAAYTATFSRVGVSADETMTALRSTLMEIEKPSNKAEKALQAVGMSFADLRQEMREKGLAAALTDLMGRFKGNEDALATVMPNVRALAGLMATAGVNADSYAEILGHAKAKTDEFGAATERVGQTTQQKWNELKASMEAIAIQLGERMKPTLDDIADNVLPKVARSINDIISSWDKLSPTTQHYIEYAIGALAVGGPLMVALAGVSNAIAAIQKLLFVNSVVGTTSVWGVLLKLSTMIGGAPGGLGGAIVPIDPKRLDDFGREVGDKLDKKRKGWSPRTDPGADIPLPSDIEKSWNGYVNIQAVGPNAPGFAEGGGWPAGMIDQVKKGAAKTKEQMKAEAKEIQLLQKALDRDLAHTFVGPMPQTADWMEHPLGKHLTDIEAGVGAMDLTKVGKSVDPRGYDWHDILNFVQRGDDVMTKNFDLTKLGKHYGNPKAPGPGMGDTRTAITNMPGTIIGAIQGGGSIVGAVAGSLGSALGKDLVKNFGKSISNTLGKTLGSVVGAAIPFVGAMIGPLVGAMIDKFHPPEWKKLGKDIGRDFGVSLSDEVLKAMEGDSKQFGRQAAGLLHLDEIIKADGGIKTDNLEKYEGKLHDVFSLIETNQLSIAQGATIIDKNWVAMAAAGTDSFGFINDQLKDIIALDHQFGTQSKEVAKYLLEQGKAGVEASNAIVASLGDQIKAWTELSDKIKAGEKDHEDVTQLLKEQAKAADANKSSLEDMGVIAMTTFYAAIGAGMSFSDALSAAGPALNTLSDGFDQLGIKTDNATLSMLMLQSSILQKNPDLLNAIAGLGTAFATLSNMGMLNVDTFDAMQRTGVTMYARIQGAVAAMGGSTKDALLPMQDYLHKAAEAADKLHIPLDANTQMLIDQSKELGIWHDKSETAGDPMIEALGIINQSIIDLTARIRNLPDGDFDIYGHYHPPTDGPGGGNDDLPPPPLPPGMTYEDLVRDYWAPDRDAVLKKYKPKAQAAPAAAPAAAPSSSRLDQFEPMTSSSTNGYQDAAGNIPTSSAGMSLVDEIRDLKDEQRRMSTYFSTQFKRDIARAVVEAKVTS